MALLIQKMVLVQALFAAVLPELIVNSWQGSYSKGETDTV
jgi:hypothetical protein